MSEPENRLDNILRNVKVSGIPNHTASRWWVVGVISLLRWWSPISSMTSATDDSDRSRRAIMKSGYTGASCHLPILLAQCLITNAHGCTFTPVHCLASVGFIKSYDVHTKKVQLRWVKHFVLLDPRTDGRTERVKLYLLNHERARSERGISMVAVLDLVVPSYVGRELAAKAKKCDNCAAVPCHDGWCETAPRWRMNSVEVLMWSLWVFFFRFLMLGDLDFLAFR